MSNAVVRIYDSEGKARDAVAKLVEDGYPQDSIYLVTPGAGGGEEGGGAPAESFVAAIKAGQLMADHADVYAERVHAGRSLVVVPAAFGYARRAAEIMESVGPVDTDVQFRLPVEPYDWNVGTPISSALCLPVLARNRPAPLSGLIGLTPVVRGQATFGTLASSRFFPAAFGRLLTRNPAPLSSSVGLKLLTTKKGVWNSSFGLPLLTRKAAPLSSATGLPTLWNKAAPLSSLLGLPTLVPEYR
jgi:hypothetical protein